jgi:hypothetical protein
VPSPIKALFAGSEPVDTLQALAIEAFSIGIFPLGTEINYVDVTDSIPPLSFLNQYDAVLAWTTAAITNPVALGNRLADYVDGGGGVVIGQMAFVDGAGLQGRVMSPGYSPLVSGPAEGTQFSRKLNFFSISAPYHPILNGVSIVDFPFYSTDQWSDPSLAPGATQIALDNNDASAIAINAGDTVIGLNMSGNFMRGGFSEPPQLIANSLLFVAGAF